MLVTPTSSAATLRKHLREKDDENAIKVEAELYLVTIVLPEDQTSRKRAMEKIWDVRPISAMQCIPMPTWHPL
jgi:hypothetical protein